MIHNFYNWYNIDDSDIGCDKVIVSQCDVPWSWMPNHVYKSICELIADCPAIHQIRNECIVDFFNTDWSKVYDTTVQKFLKLKSNWCLERAPVVCPCTDESVRATDDDPNPGALIHKIVWNKNWPYEIIISPESSWTLVATPYWPNNVFTRFDDWDMDACAASSEWATLQFRNGKLDWVCNDEVRHSYAKWVFSWGSCRVPTNKQTDIYVTNNWSTYSQSAPYTFSWNATLECTRDVKPDTDIFLFKLTQPGIYVINCNSTVRNLTEAWLQAIRWWLLVRQYQEDWSYKAVEFWDFKYDSRTYTPYVNDFYPNEPESSYYKWERNLELAIMSFNTTYTIAISETSASKPCRIWYHVRCDTNLHDHRMEWQESLSEIELELTNDSYNVWPKTTITCVRVSEYPATWLETHTF